MTDPRPGREHRPSDSGQSAFSSIRATAPGLMPVGLLLVIGLTILWGINWPIMKVGLTQIPPFTFRALTGLAGAIGLLLAARLAGKRVLPRRDEVVWICVLALFNVFLWQVLTAFGVPLLESGRAAVLAYTMPAWSVLFGAIILRDRLRGDHVLALTLGAAGILLLLGDDLGGARRSPLGALLMVGAAVSWALGSVLTKYRPVNLTVAAFVGWQLVMATLPTVALAMALENPRPVSWNPNATAALIYNMVAASIIGYWLWFRILDLYTAGVAALSTLMLPVVGVAAGAIGLGEPFGALEATALACVVGAVMVVHRHALRRVFRTATGAGRSPGSTSENR